MIYRILLRSCISLFLIMLPGMAVVRYGILKTEESRPLSVLSLYFALPAVIIQSFCSAKFSAEAMSGLILSAGAALGMHVIMIVVTKGISLFYPMTEVEKASVIYSNSSGLAIPLTAAILGDEWVIYCTGFMAVQLLFTWSHGKMLMCRQKKPEFGKMLLNPNMLATLTGLLLFLLQLKPPAVLQDSIRHLANMIAASGMLVTGMLVGNRKLSDLKGTGRLWVVVFLRMLAAPLVCLLFLKGLQRLNLHPQAGKILFVSFLQVIAPAGLTITQMAQIYGGDAEYAGMINIATTVIGIVSIPALMFLF